jgi:hypothetical protein
VGWGVVGWGGVGWGGVGWGGVGWGGVGWGGVESTWEEDTNVRESLSRRATGCCRLADCVALTCMRTLWKSYIRE